nr:UDP-N-acetylglucosamine 2-epimerase [Clostridia bacterium]
LFESEKLIVLTAHRRENIISGGLDSIAKAVKRIAEEFPNVRIIDPMHPNPAVRNALVPILGNLKNVTLIDPVGVADMHNLLSRADLCLTDSGGLQEEAPALGLPVLVLRNETERPEAAEAGTVKVIGVEEDTIYSEAKTLLTDKAAYEKMANAVNPYGDGHSSEKIADILCKIALERSEN